MQANEREAVLETFSAGSQDWLRPHLLMYFGSDNIFLSHLQFIQSVKIVFPSRGINMTLINGRKILFTLFTPPHTVFSVIYPRIFAFFIRQ